MQINKLTAHEETSNPVSPGDKRCLESSPGAADLRGRDAERGVALVVVLVLSAVVLAVMTALLYFITSGTQISGLQKRYKTAHEAAEGGNALLYEVIATRGDTSPLLNVSPTVPPGATCTGTDIFMGTPYAGFQAKLSTPSATWSPGCNSSLAINPGDPTTYDFKVALGTNPQYNYYAKIVGTIEGNSNLGGNGGTLYTGSVYTKMGGASAVPVVSQPYLYAIEVDAENASNPSERARYSILYQY